MRRIFKTREKRQPVRLADLVSTHARKWRFKHLHRIEVIRKNWVAAAGSFVAEHVRPVRLIRKTLRVAAEDSSWASEMTYLAETILQRLKDLLPGDWVEEIRIVQGEPLPDLGQEDEKPIELVQPTQQMLDRVEEACKGVQNEELRNRIRRAMLTSLRRKDRQTDG